MGLLLGTAGLAGVNVGLLLGTRGLEATGLLPGIAGFVPGITCLDDQKELMDPDDSSSRGGDAGLAGTLGEYCPCSSKISFGVLVSVLRNAAPEAIATINIDLGSFFFTIERTESIAFGSPLAVIAYFTIGLYRLV